MYTQPHFSGGNWAVVIDGAILCADCGIEERLPEDDFFPCELQETEYPAYCDSCHCELHFAVLKPHYCDECGEYYGFDAEQCCHGNHEDIEADYIRVEYSALSSGGRVINGIRYCGNARLVHCDSCQTRVGVLTSNGLTTTYHRL